MANGGTTGDDLDRLQVQVDATRTELGEVAGAVNGLTVPAAPAKMALPLTFPVATLDRDDCG